MENFLPALLIIGGVIFKIYTEFKKEQKKARQRLPQMERPVPPVAHPMSDHHPTVNTPTPAIPSTAKMTKPAYASSKIPQQITNRNRNTNKTIQSVTPQREENERMAFDLRNAVIQSAILNRPYQ